MLDLDLFKKSALAIAVAFALSACGGGGHGSSSNNGNDDPGNDDPDEPVVQVRKVTVSALAADTNASKINTIGCYDQKADEDKCKLVVYQVIPAVYDNGGESAGWNKGWGPSAYKGTIAGLTSHLNYIKDLGVNALWVTPVFHTNPSDDNVTRKTDASGYYSSTHVEIDHLTGTDESFRDFVTAAHEQDLQVILDGVFGHAKEDFVQSDKINSRVPALTDKCFGMDGNLVKDQSGKETCGATKFFDWADHAAANEKYFSELAAYMITEYGIDGWRFDQAYQIPAANWKNIQAAINTAADKKGVSGYTVAEIWDGGGESIKKTAFDGDLDSSFNFPMRYSLVKVLASQEDTGMDGAYGAEASTIETYGYNNMSKYAVAGKMYNSFTDNHDLVRFGDLIQRAGYTKDGATASVVKNDEYQRRHMLSYIFLSQMSGPITIMYNQEIGDQVEGFVNKLDSCGTDTAYCDDHVSRTDAVYDTADLNSSQNKLRNYLKSLLKLRSEHRAMYYGSRYHVFSNDKTYMDVKINSDDNDVVLFVMNTGTDAAEITLNDKGLEAVCGKVPAICGDSMVFTLTNLLDDGEVIVLDGSTPIPLEKLSGKLFAVTPGEVQ